MTPKEIGRKAGRIFQNTIPSHWSFRSQEDQEDYGIDAEIELIDKYERPRGGDSIFKVQIKGEKKSNFIKDNKFLSFSLEIKSLKYYFGFNSPVILVIVDISSKRVFWLSITDNGELKENIAHKSNQKTITIHIPIENELIEYNVELAEKLLCAVKNCYIDIKFKDLNISAKNVVNSIDPLDKYINETSNALFELLYKKLTCFIRKGELQKIYDEAKKIAVSEILNKEERFLATIYCINSLRFSLDTNTLSEQREINTRLHYQLINLAYEMKSRARLTFAIGLYRVLIFGFQMTELFPMSLGQNLPSNVEDDSLLMKSCEELKKLINICARLKKMYQYNALAKIFFEMCFHTVTFRSIHKSLGTQESIEFLDSWITVTTMEVFEHCVKKNNIYICGALYFAHEYARFLNKNNDLRELFLDSYPQFRNNFDSLNDFMDSVESRITHILDN